MNQTVFYIWQSDLPNRTNRSLIETALEGAIAAILGEELELEPVIDRDTVGLPGAPDIAQAILAKIDAATVVVADARFVRQIRKGFSRDLAASPRRRPEAPRGSHPPSPRDGCQTGSLRVPL